MDLITFRDRCMALPGTTEETPFGPDTLVYKVGGKVFAITGLGVFTGANLKCDPERAVELRERHAGITPGYHMNKRHWNTVAAGSDVPDSLFEELIGHSYALVAAALPRKVREGLG